MTGIVTSAVRDTMTNTMLTMKSSATAISSSACQIFFVAQQRDDGIGKRDRAEREFLALVDVILDEDAALGAAHGLSERAGLNATIHDIRHQHVHETRNATNTHLPRVERSK